MKLLQSITLALLLSGISATVQGGDKPDILTVETLQAQFKAFNELMPEIQKELRHRYPNPKAVEAVALYMLVKDLEIPRLKIFNKVFAHLMKNPWALSETDSLLQASSQCVEPLQKPTSITQLYRIPVVQLEVYKQELDKHHPPSCRLCRKGCCRKPRCSVLHKQYDILSALLALPSKAAEIEARDSKVFSKFQEIVQAARKKHAPQETKTTS